eukprot:3941453-Rhodomonas_salina.1
MSDTPVAHIPYHRSFVTHVRHCPKACLVHTSACPRMVPGGVTRSELAALRFLKEQTNKYKVRSDLFSSGFDHVHLRLGHVRVICDHVHGEGEGGLEVVVGTTKVLNGDDLVSTPAPKSRAKKLRNFSYWCLFSSSFWKRGEFARIRFWTYARSMPGTDVACGAIGLRACWAMAGTEVVLTQLCYGPTRVFSGKRVAGTEAGYGPRVAGTETGCGPRVCSTEAGYGPRVCSTEAGYGGTGAVAVRAAQEQDPRGRQGAGQVEERAGRGVVEEGVETARRATGREREEREGERESREGGMDGWMEGGREGEGIRREKEVKKGRGKGGSR